MSSNQICNLIKSENLLDSTYKGMSYEWDADGWLHVHGTQDSMNSVAVTSAKTPIHLGVGDYVISAEVEDGGLGTYAYVSIWTTDDSKGLGTISPQAGGKAALSVAEPVDIYLWCYGAKKDVTVDYRMRFMLVEGTTPAAWAPAEGEELSGGGALMSANLWDSSTASIKPNADGVYTQGKSGTTKLHSQVGGTAALSENQTIHMGASLKGADAGVLKPFVEYKDSAGNTNCVGFPSWQPTGSWKRFEDECVVPSGMTVCGVGFSNDAATGDIQVANPVFSYGSPVTLASDAHTPYATQDHVAAEYATKAALKVTSDAVTAEVTERGRLAGRVGTLEGTTGTHTSKLQQLAASITSLVRGESTYTDPDGASATSGIYSLVTQTRDSVTALFGSYTKTADLASTQAVKDAKKAGTDAQAAASAAQTTADSASSTAGAAKSTADSLATMVRQYSGGVLVGRVGQGVGALVNAEGSFDVVGVTWDGETPTVGKKLMRLAKNGIEFNNPDTSYRICNITANGTLTNIDVPNGSLAIDETPAWCQALGDSGYDSFIAGKMLQLGAGNRTTHSEILIEPDGTTIDGFKFALVTNNTTDTWVPVMGGNSNAGYLVHRDINLKWGPNAYAVYSAYNPNGGGDHYYTTNVNEYNELVKSGWTGNGVYFYAAL